MPVACVRIARFAVVWTILCGLPSFVGCQAGWLTPFGLKTPAPETHDPAAKSARAMAPPATNDARSVLAQAGWIRLLGQSDPPPAGARRWRHAGLDELLSRAPEQRPDFLRYLRDSDANVSANTAIALARLGDGSVIPQLQQAVRVGQRLPAFRCAAIEALADIRQPSPVAALRELLVQYGDFSGTARTAYQPELHAELLHGLARHVDPADEPRFVQDLESPAWTVRVEAVAAWLSSRAPTWPTAVGGHHVDSDPRVRAAVLRVAALRHEPDALTWCRAGLADAEFQVRQTAIIGLGQCGNPAALPELHKLLESGGEVQRAAAVTALAAAGDRARVAAVVKDNSPMVRRAVAEALVHWPDREGAKLAATLLDDPSREVQQRLFAALRGWPLKQAGPVLLAGLEKSAYLTRHTSAALLAANWPPAAEFPVEAEPSQRAAALARLQDRYRHEVGFLDAGEVNEAAQTARQRSTVSAETLARLEVLLRPVGDPQARPEQRAEAVRGLTDFGPELPLALEQLVCDRKWELPAEVYSTVLAKSDPAFAEIEDLASNEVVRRRRAAEALATRAAERPLCGLAVMRIQTLAVRESDQQVWRSLLATVLSDPNPAARQLATAAAGHPAADVRRRACEHLGAHPAPQNAAVLLSLLDDSNRAVVSAAVAALGQQGRVADPAPLRRLLTGTSEPLRHEAAAALARLGDPVGRDAVQRMTFHPNPAVRREAAVVLAELGQASAIPLLVGLLDDRPAVSNAALAGLIKLAGHDFGQVEGQAPAASSEQIRRWKDWFRQRSAESGSGRAGLPDRLGR